MTTNHDGRRREPALPPELEIVARRLERSVVPPVPDDLRGRVLGAVVDALGTDELIDADLLPAPHREPWPLALALLASLALSLALAPWMASPVAGGAAAAPRARFADRLAAAGIAVPASVAADGIATTARSAADGDSVIPTSADGAPPASIAALRLLPPEHWLKGTL